MQPDTTPLAVMERVRDATNAHDIEALAACFEPDYKSEFPAHPERAFHGHKSMRENWTQIFGAVPDIRSELIRYSLDGDTIWTEWDWTGTRRDGVPFHHRGVTIQGVEGGRIVWVRLYMEPVQEGQSLAAVLSPGAPEESRS